ncbi:MAG: hypothetical protein JXA54_17105 [Candidatus Heimdallarchaeota archaeon]|nr:hypothetical protein [Candidatus Heimdallarchaeota archaeon]
MNKMGRIFLQIGILLTTIGTLVVNLLSAFGFINSVDPGTLSDAIANLFVPWGITFLVWNVIYIGLIALTIYSIKSWFKKGAEPPEFLDKFGVEYIIASLANIAWIFFWHFQTNAPTPGPFPVYVSLIAMVVLFGSLLTMYLRLKIGKNKEATTGEKWLVHLPLSIYFGWISIALAANITATIVDLGWDAVIAPTLQWAIIWTAIIIAVATIIAILMLLFRKDIAYSLVIIWSLTGIMVKRFLTDYYLGIVLASAIGIGLITIIIIVTIFRLIKQMKNEKAIVTS